MKNFKMLVHGDAFKLRIQLENVYDSEHKVKRGIEEYIFAGHFR